jgi:tetratricopeptide (TPR) repeat protein
MDSMVRNVEFLLAEFKRDGEATDPRTIAYIGRGLLGIGEYQKAKFFLVKHITKSGWDEDRYISRCQLAECHLQLKEMEEARLCAMEATLEMPTYPDAYLAKHCTEEREVRAFAEVDTFGTFPEAWRNRLTVLRCYILACLENQADTEDLFAAKLKNYAKEWEKLLPQAQAAAEADPETTTGAGLSIFSIPLERG